MESSNPLKDLIDSFPWNQGSNQSTWYMLNWAILDGFLLNGDKDDESGRDRDEKEYEFRNNFALQRVANVVKFFPDTVKEIDRKGQHFLSMPLLEQFIAANRQCVRYKDGTGKQAIHYVGQHPPSPLAVLTSPDLTPQRDTASRWRCSTWWPRRWRSPCGACWRRASTTRVTCRCMWPPPSRATPRWWTR